MLKQLSAFLCTLISGSLCVVAAYADCPPPSSILASLDRLNLVAAARTQEFDLQPPRSLYEKAAAKQGKVFVKNNGKLGQAVNDEDHYAQDGYLPVLHSEVIGGTSRGQERVLFQYFKRAGVGRWWIDQVEMSEGLFVESGSMLWELRQTRRGIDQAH